MFVGLGCDSEIKLETHVSKILDVLIAPRSANSKEKNTDWTVPVAKESSNSSFKEEVFRVGPLKTDKREIDKHLQNIRNILLYSNATPIRKHTGNGYLCCFCPELFTMPRELKIHTLQKHDNKTKSTFMKGYPFNSYVVKIDITGLKCEICGQDIDGLEQLINHLKSKHNHILHTDIKNHILPFKFEGDTFKCVLCPKFYERFKLLQEHMNVHYNNYNCEICNSPFVNKRTLNGHMARHKQGEFSCSFCSKVFGTNGKKLCHEKFVHIGDHRRNKCPHCFQKFTSYAKKNEHMVNEHGADPRVLKCMACDKTFTRRDRLTRHTKRDHLLERKNECEHCDMKFYGKKELNLHMLKHTGEKQYKCEVCFKAFGRKHTLREHLRIHADDRRFKCDQCGQAFVQKCSWKNHMKSRHDELV